MKVALKTGEIVAVKKIDTLQNELYVVDPNGGGAWIPKDDILHIINDSLTLWDLLRGLFAQIRQLFK
jgi:hypothetical protein